VSGTGVETSEADGGVYAQAQRIARNATLRLTVTPFPDLEAVAAQLGVSAAEVGDCLRIAALLPQDALLEAGIAAQELAALGWDALLAAASAGAWESRVTRLRKR
jgi:hypothetical protein